MKQIKPYDNKWPQMDIKHHTDLTKQQKTVHEVHYSRERSYEVLIQEINYIRDEETGRKKNSRIIHHHSSKAVKNFKPVL